MEAQADKYTKTSEDTGNKEGFQLPNKKIKVTPIKRRQNKLGLPSSHENSFLFGESYVEYTLPIHEDPPKRFIDPLTKEERDFFEDSSRSGLSLKPGDLDPQKKENNFWEGFSVKLHEEGRTLNLKDPWDYLAYKILLQNKDAIAPSGDVKHRKKTYKYALQDLYYEEDHESKETDKKLDAYMAFAEMKDSPDKLKDFLKVFGKRAPSDAKHEFLKAQVGKIVEDSPEQFLEVKNDENFLTKLLVYDAMEAKMIYKKGDGYFLKPGNDHIGRTLQEVVRFLDNPKNADVLDRIKTQVKLHKGEDVVVKEDPEPETEDEEDEEEDTEEPSSESTSSTSSKSSSTSSTKKKPGPKKGKGQSKKGSSNK